MPTDPHNFLTREEARKATHPCPGCARPAGVCVDDRCAGRAEVSDRIARALATLNSRR